ncbi:MAG: YceI family protein [Bacteroidota bacterium]
MKLTAILFLLATTVFGQTQKLTVEPNHSTIGFSVTIAGGMTVVTGKFITYDLKLDLVDNDLTKSNVQFVIRAESVTTDLKDRDDHLRAEDFFYVEKYPEIVFTSTKIFAQEKDKVTVEGDLTIRGVTKHVLLPFEITAYSPEKGLVALKLRSKLNRKEFGVGNNFKHTLIENFLADDINLEINLWTKKDKR